MGRQVEFCEADILEELFLREFGNKLFKAVCQHDNLEVRMNLERKYITLKDTDNGITAIFRLKDITASGGVDELVVQVVSRGRMNNNG
jgi:hypothetical protein